MITSATCKTPLYCTVCFHFLSFAYIGLGILLQYQIHQKTTSNSGLHPTPEEVIWLGQAAKVAENRKDVLIGYVCSDPPFCWMLIMKRHVQQLLVLTLCCARKKKRLVVRTIEHKVFFQNQRNFEVHINLSYWLFFIGEKNRSVVWWYCPVRYGHFYTYWNFLPLLMI